MGLVVQLLRWLAVIPAYIAVALLVGCGTILLVYVPAAVAMVKWFHVDAEAYWNFWKASDMNGWYLNGTAALLVTYSLSFLAATTAAVRVAPSHRVIVARGLFGLTALVLLAGLAAMLAMPESESFSSWYRSLVEMIGIALGCRGGLLQAKDENSPTE